MHTEEHSPTIDCHWVVYATGNMDFQCFNYDAKDNGPEYTYTLTEKGPIQKQLFFVCAVSNFDLTTKEGCARYYYTTYPLVSDEQIVDCLSDSDCGGTTPYCNLGSCTPGSMPVIDGVGITPSQEFRYVETDTANFSVSYTDPENDMVQAAVDCGDGNGIHPWTELSRVESIDLSCTYPGTGTYTARIYLTDETHPGDTSVYRDFMMTLTENRAPYFTLIDPPHRSVIDKNYAEFTFAATDPDGDDITVTFQKYCDNDEVQVFHDVSSGAQLKYIWTGLTAITFYNWGLLAEDSFGASAPAECNMFNTRNNLAPAIDSSIPDAGSFTTHEGTNNTFSVSASDADGEEVAYDWYLDGVWGSGGGNSYRFTSGGVGNHLLTVYVSDAFESVPVPWNITVDMMGDANGDCEVDIFDLAEVGGGFGSYSAGTDMNGDGIVGLMDLVLVGKNYGRTC